MRDELLSVEAGLLCRTYLYTLFHKALGGSPSEELLAALGCQSSLHVVEEYSAADETMGKLGSYLSNLRATGDAVFLQLVESEYTRMFVGPGSLTALPWESPYVSSEALLLQESTLSVRAAYRACGFEIKRMHHVPDDHVSIECAFMAAMAERSLAAFGAGDWAGLRELMVAQCAFVRDHMANWLPRYASKACSGKTAHLYPQLAKGIAAFAELDKVFAAEVVVWVDGLGDAGATAFDGYERPASFAELEGALADLKAIRLFGLEDNELVEI